MVAVRPVYSMTLDPNSLIVLIQLKMAPDMIPGNIKREVTVKKVLIGDTPKLIDASSMLGSICCKMALEERTVYGILRMA